MLRINQEATQLIAVNEAMRRCSLKLFTISYRWKKFGKGTTLDVCPFFRPLSIFVLRKLIEHRHSLLLNRHKYDVVLTQRYLRVELARRAYCDLANRLWLVGGQGR